MCSKCCSTLSINMRICARLRYQFISLYSRSTRKSRKFKLNNWYFPPCSPCPFILPLTIASLLSISSDRNEWKRVEHCSTIDQEIPFNSSKKRMRTHGPQHILSLNILHHMYNIWTMLLDELRNEKLISYCTSYDVFVFFAS